MLCPEHWRQDAEQLSNAPETAEAEGHGFGFDASLVAFCLRFGWGGAGEGSCFFFLNKILKWIILFVRFFVYDSLSCIKTRYSQVSPLYICRTYRKNINSFNLDQH